MGKLLTQAKEGKLSENEELVPGEETCSTAQHSTKSMWAGKRLSLQAVPQGKLCLGTCLHCKDLTVDHPLQPGRMLLSTFKPKPLLLAPASLTSTNTWLCSLIKQITSLSPIFVYHLLLAYKSQSNWGVRQLIMFPTEHVLSTSFPSFDAKLCLQSKKMKLLMPHKCWGECRINVQQSIFSPFPSASPLCMVITKIRDRANFLSTL